METWRLFFVPAFVGFRPYLGPVYRDRDRRRSTTAFRRIDFLRLAAVLQPEERMRRGRGREAGKCWGDMVSATRGAGAGDYSTDIPESRLSDCGRMGELDSFRQISTSGIVVAVTATFSDSGKSPQSAAIPVPQAAIRASAAMATMVVVRNDLGSAASGKWRIMSCSCST